MKITHLLQENRPRERLQQKGAQVLSTAELLAIILKSGTKKENVIQISQKLLAKYGLEKLFTSSLKELEAEHGIGRAKASQLVALFELYRRIPTINTEKPLIKSAQDVAKLYNSKMGHLQQEHVVVVALDTKNRVIADQILTIGTLDCSLVHPREVFAAALKHAAHSIIIVHNHPSGDPTPSPEDLEVTNQLIQAGEIMGVRMLDHIIIGKDSWWSYKESK